MKKLDISGSAAKLSGHGTINYTLWLDGGGALYIQMLGNELSGTFTSHVISVAKYASYRNSNMALGAIEVIHPNTGTKFEASDNNNGAFLKAILRSILPS